MKLSKDDFNHLREFVNTYKQDSEPIPESPKSLEPIPLSIGQHKYLKGKIIFNFKKDIKAKDSNFKVLVVRIDKSFIDEYKTLVNLPDDFIFAYDSSQKPAESSTEFLWDSKNYPEYIGDENDIYSTNPKISYNFYTEDDYNNFLSLIEKKELRKNTLWYPNRPDVKINETSKFYTTKTYVKNAYPIYIVSYKRYDSMLTVKTIEELGITNYYVVIRCTEDEPENYRTQMIKLNIKNIDDKLLIMSEDFMNSESLLGNEFSVIPRRYSWNHAMNILKTSHHWCLDDNIDGFFVRNKAQHIRIKNTSLPFQFIEKYIEQYPNVFQAGIQYKHLGIAGGNRNVIIKNSRIYSCILNRHDVLKYIDNHWEGIHNEDTDLSLRILKKGLSTMTFQNFLCDKKATGSIKGGNNASAYRGKGFDDKADALVSKHGDVSKKVIKYDRPHHMVDYSPFKNNDIRYIDNELVFEKLILV
jgi:hypothetical protein